MALIYTGISGNFVIPKAIAFFRDPVTSVIKERGTMEKCELTVTPERDDLKDNRFAFSRIVDSQVTDVSVGISFTFHQHTNENRALSVGGSPNVMNITAATDLTKTYALVVPGASYWLDYLDVTNVVVESGEDTLVLNTDYTIDTKYGLLQFKNTFATVTVTYDRVAVLPTENRLQTGIGGNPDFRREILIFGQNRGPKPFIRLWDVRLTPSGSRSLSGTERSKFDVDGTCMANDARAQEYGDREEYAYGVELTIND